MNLPDVQRGMAILADHIARINTAIRQVRIRPGVGYLVRETSAGTSLLINRGTVAGGGGGAACQFFEVTDASEGSAIKVEVAQNMIAGRWPDGMGLGFPPFKLDLSGNSYIYAKVTYNTTTLQIDSANDAITILQSGTIEANTEDSVYILLATVVTGGTPLAITEINNVCSEPVPNACNLAWSAGGGETPAPEPA